MSIYSAVLFSPHPLEEVGPVTAPGTLRAQKRLQTQVRRLGATSCSRGPDALPKEDHMKDEAAPELGPGEHPPPIRGGWDETRMLPCPQSQGGARTEEVGEKEVWGEPRVGQEVRSGGLGGEGNPTAETGKAPGARRWVTR